MTPDQVKSLTTAIGADRLLFDENLKNHTYFHQNTRAKIYFEAKTSTDFELAVVTAIKTKTPFCVIGLGANIFLPPTDDFFLIKNTSHDISIKGYRTSTISGKTTPEVLIQVDSGTPLNMLARYTIHENISGLEFLLGIPGTVGGGIRNNVGLMPTVENLIGKRLVLAEVVDYKSGQKKLVDQSFFEFDYGRSSLQKSKDVLVKAVFKLPKLASSDTSWKDKQNERSNQQLFLTTGPVFKNISHRDAVRLSTKHFTLSPGYLIGQLVSKDQKFQVGSVKLSDQNFNSFILESDFEVEDISRLIRQIKKHIKFKFKLNLETQLDIIKKSLR